ncbi:MAG: PhoH family protein [Flavobacteriales bacterium]|nr:PhoH family protein [Flavobacteriales bacterium]
MNEIEISLEQVDLGVFLGAQEAHWSALTQSFPRLKLLTRGNWIKAEGHSEDLGRFQEVVRVILAHMNRYPTLTQDDVERLIHADEATEIRRMEKDDTIVYGPGGTRIAARTGNQQKIVDLCRTNDMLFAIGPAGTGKTYTAVALAVAALKSKRVKKIILTRPAVEAGENLGFLPGDLKEKLDPYMQPLYDALTDMLPFDKVADYLEKGVIEIAPLAFMRGRTLDKAFVILDEAQNATTAQIQMFLTRMGRDAKFIITGDITQIDLPAKQGSGLLYAQRHLKEVEGIGFVCLDASDVIRHRLVRAIINAFEKAKSNRDSSDI